MYIYLYGIKDNIIDFIFLNESETKPKTIHCENSQCSEEINCIVYINNRSTVSKHMFLNYFCR